MMRAFAWALAGSVEGCGAVGVVVDGDAMEEGAVADDVVPVSSFFLGGDPLGVFRGFLGDEVGGSSGFTSGTGVGFIRMDS